MGRLSLKETFQEDAQKVKDILMMFGGQDASIVNCGRRKTNTERSIPTQSHIDTCVESADRLDSKKSKYRKMIYEFIKQAGRTCDEIEVALGLRHQTASCFIRFLTQDGLLRDSGSRRETRAKRSAIVWEAI